MQPNDEKSDWKRPLEQSTQSPYVSNLESAQIDTPVVTLTPDAPLVDVIPLQGSQTSVNDDEIEDDFEPVRWQAHEIIQHDKSPVWFLIFGVVFVLLMSVAIFLIRSMTFNVLVPVMAIALLVYINRPPRMIDYTLSRKGLHINDMLYSFNEFKGFGVIHDGKEFSVLLLPVKRFKPAVSVYFPETAGEAIVDMLGARLPMQELKLDIVDRVIRKLRI